MRRGSRKALLNKSHEFVQCVNRLGVKYKTWITAKSSAYAAEKPRTFIIKLHTTLFPRLYPLWSTKIHQRKPAVHKPSSTMRTFHPRAGSSMSPVSLVELMPCSAAQCQANSWENPTEHSAQHGPIAGLLLWLQQHHEGITGSKEQ